MSSGRPLDGRVLALAFAGGLAAAVVARGVSSRGSQIRTGFRWPRYSITFERVTPADEPDEEPEVEMGWVQEGGYEVVVPTELHGVSYQKFLEDAGGIDYVVRPDDDDDETPVDMMVKILRDAGATESSGSGPGPGNWWSTSPDQDMHSGASTTHSYHLEGWTAEQEREIFDRLKPKKGSPVRTVFAAPKGPVDLELGKAYRFRVDSVRTKTRTMKARGIEVDFWDLVLEVVSPGPSHLLVVVEPVVLSPDRRIRTFFRAFGLSDDATLDDPSDIVGFTFTGVRRSIDAKGRPGTTFTRLDPVEVQGSPVRTVFAPPKPRPTLKGQLELSWQGDERGYAIRLLSISQSLIDARRKSGLRSRNVPNPPLLTRYGYKSKDALFTDVRQICQSYGATCSREDFDQLRSIPIELPIELHVTSTSVSVSVFLPIYALDSLVSSWLAGERYQLPKERGDPALDRRINLVRRKLLDGDLGVRSFDVPVSYDFRGSPIRTGLKSPPPPPPRRFKISLRTSADGFFSYAIEELRPYGRQKVIEVLGGSPKTRAEANEHIAKHVLGRPPWGPNEVREVFDKVRVQAYLDGKRVKWDSVKGWDEP